MLVFRSWNRPKFESVRWMPWNDIDMDMDYGLITMREMSIWSAQRCKWFGHCSGFVKIASFSLLQSRIQESWLAASHFISNSSLLVESKQPFTEKRYNVACSQVTVLTHKWWARPRGENRESDGKELRAQSTADARRHSPVSSHTRRRVAPSKYQLILEKYYTRIYFVLVHIKLLYNATYEYVLVGRTDNIL